MSGTWFDLLRATDAPALPAPWLMRLGLVLGWALLLALLGAVLVRRRPVRVRRVVAGALALWAVLPGPLTPDYWLGLAFHAPSLCSMLLCAWSLQRLLGGERPQPLAPPPRALLLAGVLLGYGLLLDTFAVLPLQGYAWGFSPLALLLVLGLALWAWLRTGGRVGAGAGGAVDAPPRGLLPLALLLFAATRLPTGNLWDALLDPWLWLLLQVLLVRGLLRRRT